MGSGIRIAELFETRHALDILMYIYQHPLCKKSEIYQNITRNAHTSEKIEFLEECKLINIDAVARVKLLSTTEIGSKVAESILEMDRIVFGNDGADGTESRLGPDDRCRFVSSVPEPSDHDLLRLNAFIDVNRTTDETAFHRVQSVSEAV